MHLCKKALNFFFRFSLFSVDKNDVETKLLNHEKGVIYRIRPIWSVWQTHRLNHHGLAFIIPTLTPNKNLPHS